MNRRLPRLRFVRLVPGRRIVLPAAASADTVKMGSTLGHAANPNAELCSLCVW